MNPLRVESTRGDQVESVHKVSVAVTDTAGRLVAQSGNPQLVTFWRSAAKPFQAWPAVADGAADQFNLADDALALACASHSSERVHLDVAERMLRHINLGEDSLACGPHPPLGTAVAEMVLRTGLSLTPRWSNCSGKHACMLALALHRGWPIKGYERSGHPVQDRITESVSEWTGVARDQLRFGVDGCTALCFGLPLTGMARAYARLGGNEDASLRRLAEAMMAHPNLVGGSGRFCTELMVAWPGEVIAKVGAEGIYSASIPRHGLGIALKVEDGDMRSAPAALLGVLRQVGEHIGLDLAPLDVLQRLAEPVIFNTRGEVTGALRAAGALQFSAGAVRAAGSAGSR